MDIVIAIMKYAYLALLWAFVISVVALIRKDVFGVKPSAKLAGSARSNAGANRTGLNGAAVNSLDMNSAGASAPASALASMTSQIGESAANHAATTHDTITPTGLLVTAGIAEGDFFDLRGYELSIGRNITNIVKLDDSFVSGKHARIYLKGNQYFVEDLGSTNGTNIDGKKIKHPTEAYFGSKISIGNNILEFV